MANQGSQFRFNGDAGAPSGNAVSPRSLVGALGNIGNGGQPDVDTLMSQYAAQNNNDPEALVRARWKHACMRCVPGREACTLCAAAGASDARNAWRLRAARPLHGGSTREWAQRARGSCWRDQLSRATSAHLPPRASAARAQPVARARCCTVPLAFCAMSCVLTRARRCALPCWLPSTGASADGAQCAQGQDRRQRVAAPQRQDRHQHEGARAPPPQHRGDVPVAAAAL